MKLVKFQIFVKTFVASRGGDLLPVRNRVEHSEGPQEFTTCRETIEKNEMKTFIESGMELSEENRQAYASRGGLHKTIIDFFDGVNARLKFSNSPDKINNGKGKGIPIDKDMEIERLRKQFMGYKAYSSISSSKSSKTIDLRDPSRPELQIEKSN